jgi:pimeloyl-ACP methyl ester carboxylesterase
MSSGSSGRRIAVGHSLGSHVVLDLMATDPHWAQAVLLLSVGSEEADPQFFRERAHGYADLLRAEGVRGFATRFLSEARFRDSSGSLRRAELLEEVILAGDPRSLAECADDYLPYEELTSSLIARIAPTADWSMWSVLAGIGDAPAVEWVPAARTLMPGASVSVLDGVAHLLPTDCPDVVVDEILRLVDLLQEKATPR